jgi:hypothetical protein
MEAAAASLAGSSIQLVTDVARQARERVRLIAMLNTLEFVRRSGRVSWLRANLGGLLNIKQLIEVVDGTIRRLERVRTRSRAMEALRALAAGWGPLRRLAILHTAVPEEAEALGGELSHLCLRPPIVVEVTTASVPTSAPESIGLVALFLTMSLTPAQPPSVLTPPLRQDKPDAACHRQASAPAEALPRHDTVRRGASTECSSCGRIGRQQACLKRSSVVVSRPRTTAAYPGFV